MKRVHFMWSKYYPWFYIADLAIIGLLIMWLAS